MNEYGYIIKKLIDVAYNVYERSEFEGGYAERDFLRSKDSYSKIRNKVNKSLEREIQSMFD